MTVMREEKSPPLRRSLYRLTVVAAMLWFGAFLMALWCAAAIPSAPTAIPTRPFSLPTVAPTSFRILYVNLLPLLLAAGGLFTFGLTSVMTLLASGAFIGSIIGAALRDGLTMQMVLWLTLPHSIELVALWLASAVGMLGMRYNYIFLAAKATPQAIDWRMIAKALLLAVLLTMMAAVIEGEFTLKRVVEWYA